LRNALTSQSYNTYGRFLFLLVVLVLIVYGNTFNASWHLDDRTNILDNKNVHVTSLSFEDWSRSTIPPFTDPANATPGLSGLYRPVAMVTFAFNWFLGGADVFGYHLVNIFLHCLTSILLFITCLNLLDMPTMHGRYKNNSGFIVFFATALWALNPIQIQAVTYIVQRMAVLAALFYLAGILFYIKGRNAHSFGKTALFFGLGIVSYLLALGSKQNAITLPLAWLLVEIVFYRPPGFWKQSRVRWMVIGSVTGLAAFFVLVLFYWQADPISAILEGYRLRPFTLSQRVLTEMRVLIFHLGQLFYPVPQQFSIMHDFNISTSLLTPWTTLGALIMIGTMVGGALFYLRRWPLLSFAILFFFLGHCVESTVFPLELVFEHRNYLPSLFLFLPIAAGIALLIDKYRNESKLVHFLLMSFAILIVLGISLGTHTRNSIWNNEQSLWRDALQKAPSLARPYQNLAFALEKERKLDAALRLNQKAMELKDPEPELSRFISLSNMGNIYRKKGDYPQAIKYLTEAVSVEKGPYKQRVRLNLALCLLNVREEERALKQINAGLRQQPDNIRFLAVKGFIFARHEKTDKALGLFQQVLHRNPYDRDGLVNLAMVMSSKGFYRRSEWFLKRAEKRYPHNLIIHLGLLQNALAMEDHQRANHYMSGIAGRFSMDDLKRYLAARNGGHLYVNATLVPIDDAMVISSLHGYLKKKVSDFDI
jgi:tetratricopeptide (TPR) repeat protein